jgi:prepilin-type N-terminal cleavage/methylation domain-containing protein
MNAINAREPVAAAQPAPHAPATPSIAKAVRSAARPPAQGFTLVEVLVSILIFSVVSLAMVTILLTATSLFRASERGRNASDLALASLSALDDDFRYMVPPAQGGYFASEVATQGGNGNCVLAFRILQPDRAQIAATSGAGSRLLVAWEVIRDPQTNEDVLYRGVAPTDPTRNDDTVLANLLTSMSAQAGTARLNNANPLTQVREMARGCLYFGVYISTTSQRRSRDRTWTIGGPAGQPLPPTADGVAYDTQSAGGGLAGNPFPEAVRVDLILAGGLYAPKGTLIRDTGDSLTVAGIGQIPFQLGAKVRIDNEWITLTGFGNGGMMMCDAQKRQSETPLRSTYAQHQRPADVVWGQEFCQTWLLH